MRYTTLLPFAAAAATAIVIPDEATMKGLVLEAERQAEDTPSSWWDHVPSFEDARASTEDVFKSAIDAIERQASKVSEYIPTEIEIESSIVDFLSPEHLTERPDKGHRGHHGHHGHHGTTNLTIYQAIQVSNYTKKFASLINDYPDIVKALNSTKTNITAFVPIDKAFDKIPDHHEKPPKEFIEKLLHYHIVPDYYPAGRVLASHTLPTLVKEKQLGDKAQRLRASVGIFGVKINFYAKVIAANLFTKNGVAHGIESILVPPPPAERIVSLFPAKFSTLLLAAEKTGLHKPKNAVTTGLTIFAPTNWAFEKLGPGANAFLFNTEKGKKYLKALLLYHNVANETLYSDAYYGRGKDGKDGKDDKDGLGAENNAQFHIDLPTLLHDKSLSIDISRFYGWITMKINGFTTVSIEDGIAKDGVVHVLDSVLIPPHEHRGFWNEAEGEIAVEDLMERLAPFVGEDKDTMNEL